MALDHNKLGLENKFLEKKLCWIFLMFDKFTLQNLPTNLGVCKPTLLYFLHITSEAKQNYEALYLSYRPRTIECSISQFSNTNCTQSIFRTINRGLLAKPFKKFPKSPIQPAGSHNFWQAPNLQCELWSTVWMNINRVALQHNKEFIMFIFFI